MTVPVAGAAAAAIAIVLGSAGTAEAQLTTMDGPSNGVGPFATTVRPGTATPRRQPAAPREVPIDEPPPQSPARVPLPPGSDAADPANPDATDPDGDDNRRPVIGRRPAVDGDLTWPPEPVAPRDGVIDNAQPEPTADGVSPGLVDTRSSDDLAAFERPPAGFDPDLFAFELDPILDRRPQLLYRFEPFQPVGFRFRDFILYSDTTYSLAAWDNLFRSSVAPRKDIALDLRSNVRAVSNWRRHSLEFRYSGISSFHADFPKEDDRAFTLETRGRLDVSRRTNIEATASYARSQESRGSINSAAGALDRTPLETNRAGLAFNHRFNRLSIQLRGSLTDTNYYPVGTETGAIAYNRDRDNMQKEVAVRATWELKPSFSLFGEVAESSRGYAIPAADGIKRDSQGDRVRAGVSFGTTSQKIRGEASIGWGRQRYEDSRLPEIDGILLDANLAYRISPLTALLFQARTDVSESQLAGSGGALSRTATLELRHELTRRLIGTAGLRITQQDYAGVPISERELAGILGVEYYMNRETTLFARYQHIDFESTSPGRNYDADEVRVGVRMRR